MPGSNDVGAVARTAMEQREAPASLHHRRVVGERGLVERGGPAGVVDEGVLEQPQVAVTAERVDVLVIVAEDGADALPEEGVERGGRGAFGAPDIGGQVTGRRDGRRVGRRRCRRRRLRLSRRHGSRRGPVDWRWAGAGPDRRDAAATCADHGDERADRQDGCHAQPPADAARWRPDPVHHIRRCDIDRLHLHLAGPHGRKDRTIVGRLSGGVDRASSSVGGSNLQTTRVTGPTTIERGRGMGRDGDT